MGKKRKSRSDSKYQQHFKQEARDSALKEQGLTHNPFERRRLRQKHEVLGRNVKGTYQATGQLRSRSIQKRKETLLVDYQQRNKSNVYVDKRVCDEKLSADDLALKRWQAEQKFHQKHRKDDLFNLDSDNDDEAVTLTHGGQDLGEMDPGEYPDPDLSDDDGEDEHFRVDAHLNFGGGTFDNTAIPKKTPQQVYAEIIMKSKQAKADRFRENEERKRTQDLLDNEFQDLKGQLLQFKKVTGNENDGGDSLQENFSISSYDEELKAMTFEKKAYASNREPTPSEIAQGQKDRLEALENQRLIRMKYDVGGDDDDDGDDDFVDTKGGRDDKRKSKKPRVISSTPVVVVETKGDSELPYIFDSIPSSVSELEKLLSPWPIPEREILLNRIYICFHPSLLPENKAKIKLFASSILSSCLLFLPSQKDFDEEFSMRVKVLFFLTHELGATGCSIFVDELQQRNREFNQTKTVSLEILLFCRIVMTIFPISDFRHPITTSLLLFLAQMVTFSPIVSLSRLIRAIFLLNCMLLYAQASGCFIPEALNTLLAFFLLFLSPSERQSHAILIHLDSSLTLYGYTCNEPESPVPPLFSLLTTSDSDMSLDSLAPHLLNMLLNIALAFQQQYSTKPSFIEMFAPLHHLLNHIKTSSSLLQSFQDKYTTIVQQIRETKGKPAVYNQRMAIPEIKRYRPKFEKVSGKLSEKEKQHKIMRNLKRKVKKEQAGARRELLKDNIFLRNVKQREREEEKRVVKEKEGEILNFLQNQQHEGKELEKQKRKFKLKFG